MATCVRLRIVSIPSANKRNKENVRLLSFQYYSTQQSRQLQGPDQSPIIGVMSVDCCACMIQEISTSTIMTSWGLTSIEGSIKVWDMHLLMMFVSDQIGHLSGSSTNSTLYQGLFHHVAFGIFMRDKWNTVTTYYLS